MLVDQRPRSEREASGRAARQTVPRRSHTGWTPPPDRRDVVELVRESNADRVPELVPVRHQRMAVSAFTFFRGAADVMVADLSGTPNSGVTAQLCGDCHLSNFGLFATPERRVVFDVNDFDETARGPWEWDLKRLVASLDIAGRASNLDDRACAKIVAQAAASYRTRMWEYADLSPVDVHYDRLGLDQLIALARNRDERRARTQLDQRARSRGSLRMMERLTEVVDGQLRIKADPPRLIRAMEVGAREQIDEFLARYSASLRPETHAVFDRYHFVDAVVKVGGIGSVGTRCFLALFLCDDDQPLFLQVKEASPSVLAPYAEPGGPTHMGERVVVGQRIMQGTSDIFLGWATGPGGREFYVRQAQDMKYSLEVGAMTRSQLATYGEYCAWALARAHAVSSDAATIAGYLGRGSVLDDALVSFAAAYADQNERDYEEFMAATRDGRLPI